MFISVVKQHLIKGSIVSSMPYTGNCCKNCILNLPVHPESIFVKNTLHKLFGAQFSVRSRKIVHLTGLGVTSSMAVIRTQLLSKKEYLASQYLDMQLGSALVRELHTSGFASLLPCLFNSGFRVGFPKYTYFPCLQTGFTL